MARYGESCEGSVRRASHSTTGGMMGRSKKSMHGSSNTTTRMKDVVQRIREIVLEADTRMEECIKWQAPTFTALSIRVRRIVLSLPGVNERLSHGAICFFVRNERPVSYYHDNHRGDGRISLWCPVPPGVQEELVSVEPGRFFKPPTSARGTFETWLGVFLDGTGENEVDWDELGAIIEDAYRTVAPKHLVAELDYRRTKGRPTIQTPPFTNLTVN